MIKSLAKRTSPVTDTGAAIPSLEAPGPAAAG
jgi:hypothetical protein